MNQDSPASLAASTSDVSDAKPRKSKLPLIVVTALLTIVVGTFITFVARKNGPTTSPLEPTAATSSVLVPAEHEASQPLPSAPVAYTPPTLPATPAASAAPANALIVAAVTAASGTATAATVAAAVVTDTVQTLRKALDQLTGRVDTIEAHDRVQDDQIAGLRSEVDGLKASQLVARAPATAASAGGGTARSNEADSSARPVAQRRIASTRRVAARPTPSAQTARSNADGAVLAVDLWGGTPSVAVARTGANGTELRFLNEGESQGRVTLKRAEVGSQKATFATPAGEFTLAPKEQ